MNGAVEAANKNLKKIIQKMTISYKDWHKILPYALFAYRTTARTYTGMSPYTLTYGMEAVIPIEIEIPSLCVLLDTKLIEDEWVNTRYNQLNLIDDKRCHDPQTGLAGSRQEKRRKQTTAGLGEDFEITTMRNHGYIFFLNACGSHL